MTPTSSPSRNDMWKPLYTHNGNIVSLDNDESKTLQGTGLIRIVLKMVARTVLKPALEIV
jgi:hypothetical protein